jgi:hypothetical protein
MSNRVKQKESPFEKAWQEANQLVYITQFEANMAGVAEPPAEEIVNSYFDLRDELEKPNTVFHDVLAEEIAKLKEQEKKNV